MTFHVKAWLAWTAAAMVLVLAVDNPLVSLVTIAACAVVASTFAVPGPESRAFVVMLKIGAVVVIVRAVLFGLTGHTGDTVVAVLPALRLPAWLGGFSIGGVLTAEVLAQSVAEGLRMAAFLVCGGVLLSVVDTYRVVRLVPRFLFEAALVVTIAIAFVPTMLRSAQAIRDAQRARGHRFRGLRSVRALALPVLGDALDRSATLAESMESRGYGRRASGAQRHEERARAALLVGVLILCGGGSLLLFGTGGRVAVSLVVAGAAIQIVAMRTLSRAVARTRLRAERIDVWDVALVAGAVAVAVAGIAVSRADAATWYPYPTFFWPRADLALLLPAAGLLLPALLAAIRGARLRHASHAAEVTA